MLCSAHAVNWRLGKQLDELKAGAHTELASCNILENISFLVCRSRTQPKAIIFRQFSAFTAVGCSTLKSDFVTLATVCVKLLRACTRDASSAER